MKKLKTSKSIKKRIKVTSSGKFLRHKASRSHLLQKKTSNRKKKLKKVICINKKDASSFTQKLPYLSK